MQKQALSKYYVGQIILTDTVLDSIRRVLKKVSPDVKISNEKIEEVVKTEIFKREIFGEKKRKKQKRKLLSA
jgi:predicted transcriptional regulator